LCQPNKDVDAEAQPFSNDDEHGKAIDLVLSMMKKGNGDIQTLEQPEVSIKGKTLFFLQCSYISEKYTV
jgi:hypothetical protein